MKKKISLIIISFFLLFSMTNVNALAKESVYVNDYGNILKEETKRYIIEYSNYLQDNYNIDYEVVTVNELKTNLNTDSDELYDEWNIGENGILIFVGVKDRVIRVKVGSELSNIIPSENIEKYIKDYFVKYMDNNFDKGIKNLYTAFFKTICNYENVDSEGLNLYNGDNPLYKYKTIILFLSMFICGFIGIYLGKYYAEKDTRKRRKDYSEIKDSFVLTILILLNILLFYISFIIDFKYLIILLLVEMFYIYTFFTSSKTITKKKKKIRKSNKK